MVVKVFVTGASGFLGSVVVETAARAGHEVLALVRPKAAASVPTRPGVIVVPGDLRQAGSWRDALAEADAVIHCAASFGDLPTQLAGTVLTTENLLSALTPRTRRFVHVSSLSVYDFDAPRRLLDENTPLEAKVRRRDAYTETKLLQEQLVRTYASERGLELVVARPGAIYGPGKDWDAGRALRVGRFDVIFAPLTPMRLTHVDNCADALVRALDVPLDGSLIVNIIDGEQPTHWRYHRLARDAGATTGIPVPVPYLAVKALGWSARLASKMFFGGRARLPELLDPPRQRVRWRPLRYSADLARSALDWRPRVNLKEGVKTLR
jgi:nucleoside-diphosphate-sugar epimerase